MKIKILGGNFIRETKFSVLIIGKYVLKVPFSLFALRELRMEAKNIIKAKKDPFFSFFVPQSKYFFIVKVAPYLDLLINNLCRERLIGEYFKFAFKDSSGWEKKSLKETIDSEYFLKFIKDYLPESYNWWKNHLEYLKVASSSAHGDFHLDNIAVKDNKLFFIDWIRYRSLSSRYFDLLDFYIFSKKKEKESWMEVWRKEACSQEVFGVNIDRDNWMAYGIWKTAEELKTIYLRKDLKYKRKKYINFINKLKEVVL